MKRSVLFINQVAGPLFRELAEDVAISDGYAEMLTGQMCAIGRAPCPELQVLSGPDYERQNLLLRGWSWIRFFGYALRVIWGRDRSRLLFIVSNPPFLPLVGWLALRLRRQHYCLLIYDLYPTMLVRLGRIRPGGIVARLWSAFNRRTWSCASVIFTIGDHMAANVRAELAGRLHAPAVRVIPNWVDINFIRPLDKEGNPFAAEQKQIDKITVLYSGNVGDSHDIGSIVEAAADLRGEHRVSFLIIGSGARWKEIEARVRFLGLENVRLMPLQPEEKLPLTLTTGDIAVVSMEKGTEGCMVPSKVYYYMAAGSALLAIVPRNSEVADLVEVDGCGLRSDPGDVEMVVAAVRRFLDDPMLLARCRRRSRCLAEERYSRVNTRTYIEALCSVTEHPSG